MYVFMIIRKRGRSTSRRKLSRPAAGTAPPSEVEAGEVICPPQEPKQNFDSKRGYIAQAVYNLFHTHFK